MNFRKTSAAILTLMLTLSLLQPVSATYQPIMAVQAQLTALNPVQQYIVHYTEGDAFPSEADRWDAMSGTQLRAALLSGDVDFFEPDAVVTLSADSEEQWDHEMIHQQAFEEMHTLGQEVVIGVIDSGIAPHEDLVGNILPGYDFLSDSEDARDTFGHGTKVAGLIAAELNSMGISGVASSAKLVPLKCFTSTNSTVSALVRAVYAAVDDYGCDIINLSCTTKTDLESLRLAVEYASSKGVILVAAVGNDGSSVMQYPAGYDQVIGVGSVNSDGVHASSSQCNTSVFVSAPGDGVITTGLDNSYVSVSGTSFSAPIVTGAVADMLSLRPELADRDIRGILSETASDSGETGYDVLYGYGIINLAACRERLLADAEIYISPVDQGEVYVHRVSGDLTEVRLALVTPAGAEYRAVSSQVFKLDETGCFVADVSALQPAEDERYSAADPRILWWRTLPDGNHLIAVKNSIEGRFVDVFPDRFYTEAVYWAAETHIVNGIDETHFMPDGPCTRAQLVTILWRQAGSPISEADIPFVDVSPNRFYTEAVRWAAEQGIVRGITETRFAPNDCVTRGQAVTLLYRAYGGDTLPKNPCPFTDVRPGSYCEKSVCWAAEQGIAKGITVATFEPAAICTRGQIVTFLYRAVR